jgi:hypothetical protein
LSKPAFDTAQNHPHAFYHKAKRRPERIEKPAAIKATCVDADLV